MQDTLLIPHFINLERLQLKKLVNDMQNSQTIKSIKFQFC